MISIKDVADHAGVSTATVSRVMNGHSVRADLEARVRQAVETLGYSPIAGPARCGNARAKS